MAKRTLNDRVLEAHALARESKIAGHDKHNRVRVVLVPGSEATINRVIIRRHDGGAFTCECAKETSIGHPACYGNLKGFCRHSLAAMIVAMKEQGYKPMFRTDQKQAADYVRRHSDTCYDRVWPVISKQGRHGKLHMIAVDTTAEELSK